MINRFAMGILAGAAMLLAPGAASATELMFGLTTSNPGTVSGAGRTFTAVKGATDVKARVTAWSALLNTNGSISNITQATLGIYSQGLGVSSQGDGSGNFHTVDNKTRLDFLVFQFDEVIEVDKATLTPFELVWTKDGKTFKSTDSDASISIATGGPGYGTAIGATDIANLLIPADYNIDGGGSASTPDINPGNAKGNLLLVGASFLPQTDTYEYTYSKRGQIKTVTYKGTDYDGFKFKNLYINTLPPSVPEPATWAMMIAGFGLIGSAMRRRDRATIATA